MIYELKKAFSRPEIYLVILTGAAIAVFGLAEMASDFNFVKRADRYYSAYQAAMVLQGNTAELFAVFILPLAAVLPYSDSYYRERKSGVHIPGLVRRGRFGYFMGMLCAAWAAAVSVVLVTYIINQALCLIAFPAERIMDMNGGDIYTGEVAREAAANPSMLLFLNNPPLRNALHILYACYYSGGIAVFAYALTLYMHQSRALAVLLPVAFIYTMVLGGVLLFGPEGALPLGIVYGPNYWISSFTPMILTISVMYAGGTAAVLVKCFFAKDIG